MESRAKLLWQRIFDKGTSEEADFIEKLCLNHEATEVDFFMLEKALSVIVPNEMKSFYEIHNGQTWKFETECIFRNLTLIPISDIIRAWRFLEDEFNIDNYRDLELESDEFVKPYFWNPKWIPIAENSGGDYLCLDTDPAEKGDFGQVLYYFHDEGFREVEAKSLYEFIELCLEED